MNNTLYNNIKTGLLMAVLTGLMLIAGDLIAGQQGVIIALVMAGVMNFVGYFYSDQIALASAARRKLGRIIRCIGSSIAWRSAPICRCRGFTFPRSPPPTRSPPAEAPARGGLRNPGPARHAQ